MYRWLNEPGIRSKAYCIVVMVLFVVAFLVSFGFKITSDTSSKLKVKKKVEKGLQSKGPLGSTDQAEKKN